jgi:hypothetical protein
LAKITICILAIFLATLSTKFIPLKNW